jgi:RNA polymerase sigma factor (sigma-70 family)
MLNTTLDFVPEVYEEHHLIEGLKAGKEPWLKEFYLVCHRKIYWALRNKGAEHAEVEDIIQETIMVMYEKIQNGTLSLNGSLANYTVAVGHKLWLKECRKKGRMVIWQNQLTELPMDDDDYMLTEDRYEAMERAFNALDDECREILRKRYWKNESFKGLSDKMTKTESALKMKSSRCHQQLYTWLANKI